MIEVKNNFKGGLNLDDSPYVVPNNSYIDALNVTRDAIEGSNDIALTNIVGNQVVGYDFTFDVGITTSVSSHNSDGSTIVETIFNGAAFIPAGYKVTMAVNNGSTTIAEFTTTSIISVVTLLQNLANSMGEIGIVNSPLATNNIITYSFAEGDYPPVYTTSFQFVGTNINKCIGAYSDNFRNTVIYFVWSSNDHHSILEYDNNSRTISPVFINLSDSGNLDILGFTENNKINNINIYHRNVEEGEGDILYFLDSLGRPTVMDILRFKNKEYSPVTRDIIDVGKRPPLIPPACGYNNDTTRNVNSLRDKFFRFKYRYVYDNNEKSTCSPISSMPIPLKLLDKNEANNVTNNNVIILSMDSGDRDVKSVEILMSYVNKTNDWSDFASVEVVNKNDLGLKYTYTIIAYPPDAPGQEEVFNGLVINWVSTQSLGVGTTIDVYFTNISTGEKILIATYTVQLGDTINDVSQGLLDYLTAHPINGIYSYGVNANGGITFQFVTNAVLTYPGWSFTELSVVNNVDFLNFNYSFYNDGSYPVIDINESIQIFDYVPETANAQEMPNGNVLLYGGISEGYDRSLTPNVVNEVLTKKSVVSSLGQLNATWAWEPILAGVPRTVNGIGFSGVPVVGTKVRYFFYNNGSVSQIAEITTLDGDTAIQVAERMYAAILNSQASIILGSRLLSNARILIFYDTADPFFAYHVDHIEIEEPSASNDILPTFLYSTQRKLGIAYFDKKGKTNGILYSGEIKFPAYAEQANAMLLPYINTKIYHKPPEWAYSYGFYLTKENTQFLYWDCTSVYSLSGYYYFNISNIALNQARNPTKASVLSWTFQPGDRLRLLKRTGGSPYNVYGNVEVAMEGIVTDPPGVSPSGDTYVKTLQTEALNAAINGNGTRYLIQLYRNNQQKPGGNNEVYYEFGQQYLIGNPTLPSRYHIGMTQSQGIVPTFNKSYSKIGNSITISFSAGTVLTGTTVIISNNYDNEILASYTSIQGDDIQAIIVGHTTPTTIEGLLDQLGVYLGSLFQTVRQVSVNTIQIILKNNPSSPIEILDSNVQVILPSPESIPAEFNFYRGDVYFKSRSAYRDNDNIDTYTCVDRNILDDYNSAVNDIDGRSSIIDINARRAYYSTLVRFSNAYQANTNVNGTNRFYPNNFDEYDYSFGDIMRFKVRDRFIRVFQRNKVGQVPLYHQILKEQNKENLVVTDKLLNPIQYYVGDVGIGDNPESLASYNFADYFTSNTKGVICRVSNDGVKFLSIDCKIDSWAWKAISQRSGNYKIYGAFDQILKQYIIALEATETDPAYTLMYNEGENTFDSFLSYHPEMMTTLGVLFITFKNGYLFTHDAEYYNKFYDVRYPSSVTMVFNQNPLDRKTFLSISQVSSDLWVANEIKTDIKMYGNQMESSLIESDFENLEGTYEAAILGDANSPGGVYSGDSMKGKYMSMKFLKPNNYTTELGEEMGLVALNSLSLKYINSPLNSR